MKASICNMEQVGKALQQLSLALQKLHPDLGRSFQEVAPDYFPGCLKDNYVVFKSLVEAMNKEAGFIKELSETIEKASNPTTQLNP